MSKRRIAQEETPAFNATEEEAQARRIESVAAKKKKALEALAEAQRMEADLGVGQPSYEGEDNGHGEEDPLNPGISPRLEAILGELGGEGSYTVYRIEQGRQENCGQYGLDSYPAQFMELVRELGGGTFKIMFRKPDGLIAGQHTQTFSKAIFAKKERAEGGGDSLPRYLELMEKRDEAHRRELAEARLEQTKLMAQMFQAMSQKTPMSELAAMMKILKESDAPKKSALSEVRETVELLNALKDEVEPSSPMESAISKALKMLSPILEGAVGKVLARSQEGEGAGTTLPPAAPARALPAPASSPAAPSQGAAPSQSPEEAKIAQYASMLLATILKGAEPEPTATFIVDTAKSPEAWDELCDFVDQEDLEGKLLRAAPDLSQYRDWVSKFISQLRGEVDQLTSVLAPESAGAGTAETGAPAPVEAVEGSMSA